MIFKSLEETARFAENFAKELMIKGAPKQATVLGLYGDLGSGKTTFTQPFAKALGVSETVISPTFVIMKSYDLCNPQKRLNLSTDLRFNLESQVGVPKSYKLKANSWKLLYHIDAYRLKNGEELRKLGFEKILADKNNIILIEWAEKVSDILPKNHIHINFTHISKNERDIKINF